MGKYGKEKKEGKDTQGKNQKIRKNGYDIGDLTFFDTNRSYTYTQAAQLLGVSVRTVMREVKANRLIAHKVRGCTRIHVTDFLAYTQDGKCT